MALRVAPLALLLACQGPGDGDPAIPPLLPAPVRVEDGVGAFRLDEATRVGFPPGQEALAEAFVAGLRPSTGLPLALVEGEDAEIVLVIDEGAGLLPEGYVLDVTDGGVVIAGADPSGLAWGTQTLRQLLPPAVYASEAQDADWALPVVHIEALWTELIADEAQADLMTWPRLSAIADRGWISADRRDVEAFRERLLHHQRRLDALQIGYYRGDDDD